MSVIFYDRALQHDVAEFLEDLADAVVGVERCKICGAAVCDHPDLQFAGIVPPEITPSTAAEIRRRRKDALRGVGGGVSVSHEDASA